MSKVLLTGMTASQASPSSNFRAFSYAGLVADVLMNQGHTVYWKEASVTEDSVAMDEYDAVLVGVSPITSLAANRTYGALNVIDRLYDSDKLTLFIDAPRPELITQSLRSVGANPDSFVKDFYSYRIGFDEASRPETRARLMGTVERLLNDPWPTTIYPTLPWEGTNMEKALPGGALSRLYGVNIDSTLGIDGGTPKEPREALWAATNLKGKWIQRIQRNVINPIRPMKSHKNTTDKEVQSLIESVTGVLMTPERNGETWWSFRYAQALHAGTPIATEWRQSSSIGGAWSVLPSHIEALGQDERNILAVEQREAYMAHLDSSEDATKRLCTIIGVAEEGVYE